MASATLNPMYALAAALPVSVLIVTGEYSAVPVTSPIGQVNAVHAPVVMNRLNDPVPSVTIILEDEKGEPLMAPVEEMYMSKLPRLINPLLVKSNVVNRMFLSRVSEVVPAQTKL